MGTAPQIKRRDPEVETRSNPLAKLINKAEKVLIRCEECYSIFGMLSMVFLIVYQVICRYVLFVSTPWVEELARYLFATTCFIAGGYVVHNREHIQIDLIDDLIEKYVPNSRQMHYVMFVLSQSIVLVFSVVMACSYWDWVQTVYHRNQPTTNLPFKMWVPLAFLLAGLILTAVHSACLLITQKMKGPEENERGERV